MTEPHAKRLRVFAGPNGSGKTTLAQKLSKEGKFRLKVFVNADEIEKELTEKGSLSLAKYRLKTLSTKQLVTFIEKNGMSAFKTNTRYTEKSFEIKNRQLFFYHTVNSYIASDIAAFLRNFLLEEGISFAFETVFSHESKLEFMKKAKQMGYKVYLYFLATDDPEININRVDFRVEKNGHSVPAEKIRERYYRSLNLLLDAVKVSFRSFLFDNSGRYLELVAKVDFGKKVEVSDYDKQIPGWFYYYFYKRI